MAKRFFVHAFLDISQSSTKHRSLGSHRSQVQVKALWIHKWQAVYKSGTGTRGRGHRDACVGTWDLGTSSMGRGDVKN